MGAEIYLSKGFFDLAEEKLVIAENLYKQFKIEYQENDNIG